MFQCHLLQGLFQQSPKWSGNWQLQQDNAPPHKNIQNMALIASSIPTGHFLLWPADSPDSVSWSPIKYLWGWMDTHLHKQQPCKSMEELKARLETIRQSVPASMLHALFDGIYEGQYIRGAYMRGRMQRVVQRSVDHIGR